MTPGKNQSPRLYVDGPTVQFMLTPPSAPPIGRPPETGEAVVCSKLWHQVYKPSDLKALCTALDESTSDADAKVARLANTLLPTRCCHEFGEVPGQTFFAELRIRFPHMHELVALFSDMAHLSNATQTGYQVPPVLLEGPPGVGKTAFAQALARAIGGKAEILDMSALSAGFLLSGSHPSWSAAKQGRIFDLLTQETALANPVVVLDELDKVGVDKRYDPCGPLYSLLEPCSARAFKDEFIPLPIDASAIIWIATCNRAADVPAPILSRFERYYIEEPSADAWAAIAQSIWTDLLAEKPRWTKILAPTLAGNVITRPVMNTVSPAASRAQKPKTSASAWRILTGMPCRPSLRPAKRTGTPIATIGQGRAATIPPRLRPPRSNGRRRNRLAQRSLTRSRTNRKRCYRSRKTLRTKQAMPTASSQPSMGMWMQST